MEVENSTDNNKNNINKYNSLIELLLSSQLNSKYVFHSVPPAFKSSNVLNFYDFSHGEQFKN